MPPHDLTLHREIPPAPSTMIGRGVGRYRVVAALGRGGMSSVWRAHDELLGRDVALKLLAAELAASARARRRFRHEARVAASLDHPAVAAVYDSGEADGVTFIAMALIEGETVAERLERSLMPIAEALRVAGAVAGALAHAHSRGVVHRDVTSRNIMLARDGRVLVLDFGLALAAGMSRVSSSRTMVGTASYMAPEVLQGRDADSRSDLYGLGVVLHEMLTGRVPFDGERREAITYAALNQEPTPPSRWRAEVGPELDRVVMRLLARSAEERYASAETVLADLRALPGETRGPATPAEASRAPSPATRSVAAELLASANRPLYLAIAPFEVTAVSGVEGEATRLAADLVKTLSASVTHLGKVHLVTAEPPGAGEDPGQYSRRVGAHALLAGTVRVESATARVSWRLVDADRGAQIAAGSVRGAAVDVVSLENELVADVRRGLGLKVELGGFDSRAVTQVPAAADLFQQAIRDLARFDHEASVDGGIRILERLADATPEDGVIAAWLARAYLAKFMLTRQQMWEAHAAERVQRAMEAAPGSPETLLAAGELYTVGGRYEAALSSIRRVIEQRPDWFEALLALGRAHEAAAQYDEAERACRAAIENRPGDWRGHHVLGLALFKRGEFGRAVEPWQEVLRLTPDNAQAASNLGSALFHLDRHDDAIAAFERSIELRPNKFAYSNLATVLFYTGQFEKSTEIFERAVELTPSDPAVWGNLGNACRLVPGKEERAREALERATGLMLERLQRHPAEAESWARLSGWWANLGRVEDARRAAKKALELAPRDVHVMVHAANAYCQTGDADEAFRWLEAAVDAGFGLDVIRHAPDLAPLRGDPRFSHILARRSGASEASGGSV